jgi:anti-anti-sigma regulatory factor
MSGNPHQQRTVDVEIQDGRLLLTPGRDFDENAQHVDWAQQIIRSSPGPFSAVIIDLGNRPMISSTFFAGMLQLIDHYQSDTLQRLELHGVSSRIVRTIEMMNMSDAFSIQR